MSPLDLSKRLQEPHTLPSRHSQEISFMFRVIARSVQSGYGMRRAPPRHIHLRSTAPG
jgi:hypothetical protein